MSECTALATKLEVKKVEAQVSGKLDQSEKPRIIQTASALGATAALGIFDPRIQALLAELAKIGGEVKALGGKLLNFLGKLGGILNLIALAATQVSLQILVVLKM
ncbi:hypothetical protein [Pleurocapsa sp. FMAR1]|uniref:hypothetical protein n=1 Tax=Pleurocapsa sp. FMAR1 TaxID=3040204 RepID=UPI0029C7C391|nr:hypothetical protein [Pleurocapsa sp. FMAR1]